MTTLSRAADIAASLIRIPSVNPSYDAQSAGEGEVARWIASWASERGLPVEIQSVTDTRSNVLIRLERAADRPHLLLNGHTDTVGVSGMSIDPFGGEVRGGRLYGRGAADMKGPLACMMSAMLMLQETSENWSGTVTFAAVVDEEYRFRGIQKLLDVIEPIDFAIVGEPTSMKVVRGCKGCLRFVVVVHGRAAHSSRPSEGANAISAMAQVIIVLEDYFARRLASIEDADFGSSTGSIGLIHGGTGVNVVPDRCEIQVDVRLLPGQDGMATHREIVELLSSAIRAPGIRCEVGEPSLCDAGFEVAGDDPFVVSLLSEMGEARAQVASFSCDASKIARHGARCVVLGPGDIAQAHTIDESIGLEELQSGEEMYFRIARALLV